MSRDKLPVILRILDAENRLLERSDQKAISMLSILGVFMVFFIVYHRVLPVNAFTVTLIVTYVLCSLGAILNLIMAIRPRVRKEPEDANSNPPLSEPAFFMGICQFPSVSEYQKAVEDLASNDDNLFSVYTRQVFSLARINAAKYKYLQRGMLLVVIALATELSLICYLFINYMGEGVIPPIS
ncbi:MAG: DUF5706 domain-containing protein [Dehalococcoidales bacterium]|nr:DUF5706 domain-containing protein [Dehalococcoidales bacterium]